MKLTLNPRLSKAKRERCGTGRCRIILCEIRIADLGRGMGDGFSRREGGAIRMRRKEAAGELGRVRREVDSKPAPLLRANPKTAEPSQNHHAA